MHYCYQEKENGAILFSGEGNWCSTARLLISRDGDWCSTVLGRRAMGLYLSVFIGFIYLKPKSLSVYLDKRFHADNG